MPLKYVKENTPETIKKSSFYPDLMDKNLVTYEETTFLNKHLGNPIFAIGPLNAALYWHLGKREPIKESIPVWNQEENKVNWMERMIEPNNAYVN